MDIKKVLSNKWTAWLIEIIIVAISIPCTLNAKTPFIGGILPAILMTIAAIVIYYGNPLNTVLLLAGAIAVIGFGFCFKPGISKISGWWIYAVIIIAIPILMHILKKEVTEPKEAKDATIKAAVDKITIENTYEGTIADIQTRETLAPDQYIKKVKDAENDLIGINNKIEDDEATWISQKEEDLAPLISAKTRTEANISKAQKELSEQTRIKKDIEAESKKFSKNTPQAAIDAYNDRLIEATRSENAIKEDIRKFEIDLVTQQSSIDKEEVRQNNLITPRRSANQKTLRDREQALRFAKQDLAEFQEKVKPTFDAERREAKRIRDEALSRLEHKDT